MQDSMENWADTVVAELGVDNEGNKIEQHSVNIGPSVVEIREDGSGTIPKTFDGSEQGEISDTSTGYN